MVAEDAVGANVATLGLFIAATVNQVTKLGLATVLDGSALSLRILPAYLLMGAVGLGVALAG